MNTEVQGDGIYAKPILNFKEACELTGFTASYMRKLCMWNVISFSKPNGKVLRFERKKLEAWLLSNPNTTIQERQTKAVLQLTTRKQKTKQN